MGGFGRGGRDVAVIGTGISGMSAAWLASQNCAVTVYEKDGRVGGHSYTVLAETEHGRIQVDMGFIVYNHATYPNLVALFDHLGVASLETDMSLAISLDDGRLEYAGGHWSQLFTQKRNIARPRFWSMMRDLLRFYREAPGDLAGLLADNQSLGDYLTEKRYGAAFVEDHLLPMAAAIWSCSRRQVLAHPAASFIRFQETHGLLKLTDRPVWRTVAGGSQSYVEKLTRAYRDKIRCACAAVAVKRLPDGVEVRDATGGVKIFDDVIIATHADEALALLVDPTEAERALLGAFRYTANRAWLHRDARLMPKRRRAWAAWNYLGHGPLDEDAGLTVTYWMNKLQHIRQDVPLFVTLNPAAEPDEASVHRIVDFAHPIMDAAAVAAQAKLWSVQGIQRTWYCGAYFGAGFHEDGLQAGLAVAEAVSGARRPWSVENESGRIALGPAGRWGEAKPAVAEALGADL